MDAEDVAEIGRKYTKPVFNVGYQDSADLKALIAEARNVNDGALWKKNPQDPTKSEKGVE